MNFSDHSRRDFLRTAALGTAGLAWPSLANAGRAKTPESTPRDSSSVRLGVASYSLREFDREKAIAAIQKIGTPFVSIKSFHLPYEDTPEELAAGCRAFKEAGLQIVGGGVIYLQKDDDDDIRFHFEYAKKCGMPLMVIGPTPATLPRIERFVKEYGIKVAIHNHGPEDEYFPGPQDILPVIRDMDPGVGVCLDVGHTTRTGIDVVEAMALSGDRLLDFHIKDLRDLQDKESQCIVGQGAMPIARIFRQLEKMSFSGYVNLEYEIDAENPLPGMKESFAYMRGVLAGMVL